MSNSPLDSRFLGKRLFEENNALSITSEKKPWCDESVSSKVEEVKKNLFDENDSLSSPSKLQVRPFYRSVKKETPAARKLFSDEYELPEPAIKNTLAKTAKRSLDDSDDYSFGSVIKKPRLAEPSDLQENYIPSHLRKHQQKASKTIIKDIDPLNPSEEKVAEIPGIQGSFPIEFIGKGVDRTAYAFTENHKIIIDGSNPYFLKAAPGEYDLDKVIIKTFNNQTKNPKERQEEIKREMARYDLPENCDLSFRPKIIFYGADGTICEEKGISLESKQKEDPNALARLLEVGKRLIHRNIKSEKTVVFDVNIRNLMFSVIDGRVMHVDRGSSCSEKGFKKDAAKDLSDLKNYGNPTPAEKAARWAYLTEGYDEEEVKNWNAKVRQIESPVKF